jgi:hypothetical protein
VLGSLSLVARGGLVRCVRHCGSFAGGWADGVSAMTATLIGLAILAGLIAAYGAVLWLTREGGPADINAWWDWENDR